MTTKSVIFAHWKGLENYKSLQNDIERNLTEINEFNYLLLVDKPKEIEQLPKLEKVNYISRKDFNLFGKLKNQKISQLLNSKNIDLLIFATLEKNKILERIENRSNQKTIGVDNESLPNFDLSFKNIEKIDASFFKQINKYLTQIQWK